MELRRKMEIIRILLKQNDYITIKQLSTQLNVSGKTIRNDLTGIGDWLSENGLTLIKKTGVGIRIEGNAETKLATMNLLDSHQQKTNVHSPQARKIYIALRLITCEENCRIYELAEELYVSRATIHKDISSLSGLLDEHHISLVRKNNNGVHLVGKERSLRDMMLHLMEEDAGYTDFIQMIQNPAYVCHDAFIYAALDYTDRDIFHFVRLILDSGNPFISSLSFRPLLTILLRLFICLIRILDGRSVTLSDSFIQELETQALYPEACAVGKTISIEYGQELSTMELRYFQIHFLSLQNRADTQTKEQAEASGIARQLLASWEQTFRHPFTQDKELLSALSAHLEPAVTRIRHGITIENPMMYEIQTYYRNTFLITRESVRFIEDQYHCSLSDDEVGYIAIYLATALEGTKHPLSTILVSHGGKGAAKLLRDKLSLQIPEIKITSLESFISIQNADLTNTELILSTLELPVKTQIPSIRITPLPSYQDILRLKEVISVYYKAANDPLSNAGHDDTDPNVE